MRFRTLVLRVMLVAAAAVVALLAFGLLTRYPQPLIAEFHAPLFAWAFTLGLWAAVLAFETAAVLAWRLLDSVAAAQAFSVAAVRGLARLKWAVGGISAGLALTLPQIYQVADAADAPGLMLIGLAVVALPLMVATFLAVLGRLWTMALTYKQAAGRAAA
ncbi:DUF2975 domain-containing protein [Lacticaseibacillus kribbianus]|uniref:DUF2975 domain-containing protein n=1 Tax=Lacticaseibacillus kribbianus TaxID=2926292 RepID=UPI001CD788A4|nr:DUF2975 domain-containing protein [Lacticaseibacillus kribbianus]